MGWGGLRSGQSERRQNQPAAPIITQDMLAELRRGKAQAQHYRKLRMEVTQLHESGAVVENGPLDVDLKITTQRRLTTAALVEVLGAEEVEELKDAVEPTVVRTLVITERETEAHRLPQRPVPVDAEIA